MVTFEVSWFAVIFSALAGMVVGMAWYSKSLFGTQWAKEMGWSQKDMDKKMKEGSMGKTMAVNFIFTIIMAFVLANVLALSGATTIGTAAVAAFWLWIGFILPLLVGGMLWEGKSQRLLTINAAYWLVSMVIMAAVIALLTI
jgi:hypothetical protein